MNQKWDEQLRLQPPLRPTNVNTSQVTNEKTNIGELTGGDAATGRQVEVITGEGQNRQSNEVANTYTQPNATNRRVEQASCTQCNCHPQSGGARNTNVPPVEKQRYNLHSEYEDKNNGTSNFFQGKRQSDERGSRECQIIRILPEESDDYMDIVRNSVSAQTRNTPKPMFVNNYFVGDNNWRSVPRGSTDVVRHYDESRSRSSTGVQTAVSFLGEEDKGSNTIQTGLARVKSMGKNEADANVRSPVVMEPTKQGNSTGWSTHSFNIPDVQQDIPGQQCKGFPDFTVPPPPISTQAPSLSPRCSDPKENTILRVMEKMTETINQQMNLSAT